MGKPGKPLPFSGRITFGEVDVTATVGETKGSIQWIDIAEVHAFKRDLFTTDRIELILVNSEGNGLRIDEDMDGYEALLDEMVRRLPGFDRHAWWFAVALPAFETNHTIIWTRSGGARTPPPRGARDAGCAAGAGDWQGRSGGVSDVLQLQGTLAVATSSSTDAGVRQRPILLILGPGLVMAAAMAYALGSTWPLACFTLLGIPIGLCVCLVGLCWKPRWPYALGLVVGLSTAGYIVAETHRLMSGRLRPGDYPQVLELASGGTTHFPRAIPANATDIRITAEGPYGWLPAQDYWITLRFILPPSDAENVRARAEKEAISADPKIHGANCAGMSIKAHGGDPAEFKSYLLVIPNGGMGNEGGVSVNTATGEVVYWVMY